MASDPRWGRTEEGYGEDPYLISRMGVAAIEGLQGESYSIDRHHVLATAKHFAVHGVPEGGTNTAPGNISERVIRETYLVPFQAAVQEAHAGSVMASYNEIDGVPNHINHWLLDKVLRHERAADMIALLTFYHYTALWQRTNQPRASIKFVAKKLRWGEAKVRAIKKLLTRLKLIEDLCATHPQTKKITGWYVKLAYFHPVNFAKGGSANPPSQFSHSMASRYPDALRANTSGNGSTEPAGVPDLQA